MLKKQTRTKSLNYRIHLGLFIMIILGLTNLAQAQNYVTIAPINGALLPTAHNKVTPFSTKLTGGLHQYLITAAELNNNYNAIPGFWSSVGFDITSIASTPGIEGLTIKLKTTSANQIPLTPVSGATVYFNSTATELPTLGWNDFNFTSPFFWNGTDNIIVQVCFTNTTASTTNYGVNRNWAGTRTLGLFSNTTAGCNITASSTRHIHRPNMRFELHTPSIDARVSNIVTPIQGQCSFDSIVKVEIENNGTDTLTNAAIHWSVNGNPMPTYNFNGSIPFQEVDTLTIGNYSTGFNHGDTIKAWTVVANDSNLLNDTTQKYLYTALHGDYTIDTSGLGDYNSFNDAIQDLNSRGVCSSVVFTAMDSLYLEQLTIGAITGASQQNQITFRSQNGNHLSVKIRNTGTSTANWTVRMKNARFINFVGIGLINNGGTNSRVVISNGINDNSRYITFDSCQFLGSNPNSGATSKALVYLSSKNIHHWKFTNSTFKRGSYHIYIYGYSTSYVNDFEISNNSFLNSYSSALDASYVDYIKFKDNKINSNSASTLARAIDLSYCREGNVSNNQVIGNGDWPRYGIYMYRTKGDLGSPFQIHNNRIHIEDGRYGIYSSDNEFLEIAHNSILVNGAIGRALYTTQGGYSFVHNNILQITNTGYAVKLDPIGINQMDHNVLSAPNGILANNGADQATLNNWQSATGFGANSLIVDSIFSDSISLTVCNDSLYAKGMQMPSVTHDMEYQPRATTPCIGADEFLPTSELDFSNLNTLCDGDTVTLTQNYFNLVIWDSTFYGTTFSIHTPGLHQIQVSGSCGSILHPFTIPGQQNVDLTDTTICNENPTFIETNISNGQYIWHTGSIDSVILVDSNQLLSVQVTDSAGCVSSDSAFIEFSPEVNLLDSAFFCETKSYTIRANAPGNYLWDNGVTSNNRIANHPGYYSVTVTNQQCISSDSIYVSEILNPVADFVDSSDVFTVAFTNLSTNATSYKWYFGDGDSSSYEHPVHLYPYTTADDTSVIVFLNAYNQCGSSTKINPKVSYGKLVSVSEISFAESINIYPNPTNGQFTVGISSEKNAEGTLNVYDTQGKQVYFETIQTQLGTQNIPVNLTVPSGIYFVSIQLDNQFATYRLVVE